MFGHTWVSQYGVDPQGLAGDTWGAALAGLTAAQVGIGLKATLALGAEFPPSAPHFRALCFDIPSFAAVRFEMTHAEAGHTGFGILVWHFVDSFRLRTADNREADRLARDAYELAKAHVLTGGEVPDVPKALVRPEPKAKAPARSDTVNAVLRGMGLPEVAA